MSVSTDACVTAYGHSLSAGLVSEENEQMLADNLRGTGAAQQGHNPSPDSLQSIDRAGHPLHTALYPVDHRLMIREEVENMGKQLKRDLLVLLKADVESFGHQLMDATRIEALFKQVELLRVDFEALQDESSKSSKKASQDEAAVPVLEAGTDNLQALEKRVREVENRVKDREQSLQAHPERAYGLQSCQRALEENKKNEEELKRRVNEMEEKLTAMGSQLDHSKTQMPELKHQERRMDLLDDDKSNPANSTNQDSHEVIQSPSLTRGKGNSGSIIQSTSTLFTAASRNSTTNLEYTWKDSIWDIAIFVGVPELSIGSSVAIVLCLVLYFVLTVALALESYQITQSTFNEDSRREFEYWRTSVAHDVSLQNSLTGESLATSVCNEKIWVPYSSYQLATVSHLKQYLQPQAIFGVESTAGQVMCALVLSVWLLTLSQELRTIEDVASACLHLPIAECTNFEEDPTDGSLELTSMTPCRAFLLMTIFTVRLAVLVFVGLIGVLFLVNETSVYDQLLNAVAMEIILNLDDLMFAALLPKMAQATLARISPLKYQRLHKLWHTLGSLITELIGLGGLLLLIWLFIVTPFADHLISNLDAMCGGVEGSLDFVIAVDSIGIPWAAAATASSQSESRTYAQHAVHEVMKYGFRQASVLPSQRANDDVFMKVFDGDALRRNMVRGKEFESPSDWTLLSEDGLSEVVGWEELPALHDADFGDQVGTVFNHYLGYLLGGLADARCSDVQEHQCIKHGSTAQDVVMRKLCPGRCGCDLPTKGTVSNPFARDPQYGFIGCASWNLKREAFVSKMKELPCNDTTSESVFLGWVQGVGRNAYGAPEAKAKLRRQLQDAFAQGGCDEAARVDIGDGSGTKINMCSESSLAAICPVACGCDPTVMWTAAHSLSLDFCPYSCGRENKYCQTIAVNHTGDTGTYGPKVGYACNFPFKYKEEIYNSCTDVEWTNKWCAVSVTILDQTSLHWGDCEPGC